MLSVCYQDFRLKPKHLLHLLPFLLINILLLPGFYLVDAEAKNQFLTNGLYLSAPQLFSVFGEIQWLFYIAAVIYTLNRFRKIYRENYAATGNQTYKWLFQITSVFIVAHIFVFLKSVVNYTSFDWTFGWLQMLVGFTALSVTCWFVLKAMYFPELFRGVDSSLQTVENIVQQKESDDDSPNEIVKNPNEHPEIQRLKSYMEREKPHLDSSLTLQKLANQMEMSSRDLSILINHELGQHFFDFVNKYRVEEATEILENKEKSHLTVLEILYEVGFNSKSSFNTAFKKHTNLTPTQYRKIHI